MSPQLMKYMKLDQRGSVMAEYIWIDGLNGVRSKTKVRTSLLQSLPSPLPPLAQLSILCYSSLVP